MILRKRKETSQPFHSSVQLCQPLTENGYKLEIGGSYVSSLPHPPPWYTLTKNTIQREVMTGGIFLTVDIVL